LTMLIKILFIIKWADRRKNAKTI
jgi:hypothetical protein